MVRRLVKAEKQASTLVGEQQTATLVPTSGQTPSPNEKETKTKTVATTTTSLGERSDGWARPGWTTSVRDVDRDDFVSCLVKILF